MLIQFTNMPDEVALLAQLTYSYGAPEHNQILHAVCVNNGVTINFVVESISVMKESNGVEFREILVHCEEQLCHGAKDFLPLKLVFYPETKTATANMIEKHATNFLEDINLEPDAVSLSHLSK